MKNNKLYILNNSVFTREVLPGSIEESIVIDKLKNLFKDKVDWIRVFETPTLAWFEKECIIENNSRVYKCRALPYTISSEIEGYPVNAIYSGDKVLLQSVRDYSIAFIEFPPELDLVKYIVLELSKYSNIVAVVFYDREPDTYRICVVTGDYRYSLYTGSPPPLPVISITREEYFEIMNNPGKLRIKVKTVVNKDSFSKTLVMGINGSSDREIHLTAHHDHWFTGFSDNLVGLEILYRLTELFRNRNNRYSIVFISYTGEEIGGLNYASWYWAWGSRYYLKTLSEKNVLDKIIVDINIDSLYQYPIEIYGNPCLKHCISTVENQSIRYIGFDHVDFDSFSYTLFGIPALTITSIGSMKNIYHTNRDNGFGFNYELLNTVSNLVIELIKCIETNSVKYSLLIEHIIDNIGSDNPVELKNFVSKLFYLNKFIESEEERVRFVTKYFTGFTYVPGLKHYYSADLLSDIVLLKKLIRELDQYIGNRFVLLNYDNVLIDLEITEYNINEVFDTLYELLSIRTQFYNSVYERELIKYIYSRKE